MATFSLPTTRRIILLSFGLAFSALILFYHQSPEYLPQSITSLYSDSSNTCLGAIQSSRKLLLSSFADSLQNITHVAVVDYPDHSNKGDAAIWLGEVSLLEALNIKVTYVCHAFAPEYQKADLIASFGDVPNENTAIMMHGGGNLGDIWWFVTQFKINVVDDHHDRKIRFFPQTVSFSNTERLGIERLTKTQKSFGSHPDLELVGRDTVSYAMLVDKFPNNKIKMLPDMAFMIGYDPRSSLTPHHLRSNAQPTLSNYQWPVRTLEEPTRDVTIMNRRDGEGGQEHYLFKWEDSLKPYTALATDWLNTEPAFIDLPLRNTSSPDGTVDWLRYWNVKAMNRVEWAFDFLTAGKMFIADRLHAHILGTLLGVGHVIIEGGEYKKIQRYQNTWLDGCLADVPDEADKSRWSDAVLGMELAERKRAWGGGEAKKGRKTDALAVFIDKEEDVVAVAKTWLEWEKEGVNMLRVE